MTAGRINVGAISGIVPALTDMSIQPDYTRIFETKFAQSCSFYIAAAGSVQRGTRSWPGYPEGLMHQRLSQKDLEAFREAVDVFEQTTQAKFFLNFGKYFCRDTEDFKRYNTLKTLAVETPLTKLPPPVRTYRKHVPILKFGAHLMERGTITELETRMLDLANRGHEAYLLARKRQGYA